MKSNNPSREIRSFVLLILCYQPARHLCPSPHERPLGNGRTIGGPRRLGSHGGLRPERHRRRPSFLPDCSKPSPPGITVSHCSAASLQCSFASSPSDSPKSTPSAPISCASKPPLNGSKEYLRFAAWGGERGAGWCNCSEEGSWFGRVAGLRSFFLWRFPAMREHRDGGRPVQLEPIMRQAKRASADSSAARVKKQSSNLGKKFLRQPFKVTRP